MTEREALKLARDEIAGLNGDPYYSDRFTDVLQKIDAALAQPEQEPVAKGKLKVTLQDTPTEVELAQYKRMFEAACAALGAINEALGLDPNDGGAEPILHAIEELKAHPKEPEQEPVAWITNNGDGWLRWHRAKDNNSNSILLYTTPPQRKPLTDEQLIAAYESEQQGRWGDHVRGLRAVEETAHNINGDA